MEIQTLLIDPHSLSLPSLAATVLLALRIGCATLMLPVLQLLPWRARIAVAIVLGGGLASVTAPIPVVWSFAGMLSEILTGGALGIGLRLMLSALQAAGTWIDEQTSTGLAAEQVLIDAEENTLGTAQLLTWLGAWLLLTSTAFGTDLEMLHRVIDSQAAIPVGRVISPSQIPTWSIDVLRSWSQLAIGVAFPVCLLSGLIQAGLSLVGRGLGVNLGQQMSTQRAGLTCVLLFAFLPTQAERIDHFLEEHRTVSSDHALLINHAGFMGASSEEQAP